jgi:transcriptional regulator with GAF, ATPase, and Fis domain
VNLNYASIPFDPLESELFGLEKGAFTGPVMQANGRFETADTGTLFLDEIGDLPIPLEPKIAGMLNKQIAAQLGTAESAVRV